MLHMAGKETSWLQLAVRWLVVVCHPRVVLLFWYCCRIELVSSFDLDSFRILVRLVFIGMRAPF